MTTEITMTWAQLQPALPEIYLTAAICVLLMADVFFGHTSKRFTPTFTLLLLAGGAVVTALYANVDHRIVLFARDKRHRLHCRCSAHLHPVATKELSLTELGYQRDGEKCEGKTTVLAEHAIIKGELSGGPCQGRVSLAQAN